MMRFAVLLAFVVGCREDRALRQLLVNWEVARSCMLSEYGPDTTTSVIVASLAEGRRCSDERLKLLLTRDEDIEQIPGWRALNDDLRQLRGDSIRDAPVIDRIDARVAKLRQGAGLPPINREPARSVVSLPVGRTIVVDGRVLSKASLSIFSGRVQASFRDGDFTHTAEIVDFDGNRSVAQPIGFTLAYPSRSWAVKATASGLAIFDATTRTQTPVSLPIDARMFATKAMDAGDRRAVFLQLLDGKSFAVAFSADRGRTWKVASSPYGLPLVRSSQDPETGTVDVMTHAEGFAYLHRFERLDPFTIPAPSEIPRFEGIVSCRSHSLLWAKDQQGGLYRIGVGADVSSRSFDVQGDVVACHEKSALLLQPGQQTLRLCRGEACKMVHEAKHGRTGVATLLDGTWGYAAMAHGVVGVWREKVIEPQFYRLATQDQVVDSEALVGMVVLKDSLHLVLVVDDQYRFVPLPK